MSDSWFENYARITPYVLVIVGVLVYLYAGGIWWGAPIIAVAVLLYALLKVRVTRWSKNRVIDVWIDESRTMNRILLGVIFIVIVGVGLIEAVRLLLGEGWSWIIIAAYGVALIALTIAARLSRNAPARMSRAHIRH